MDYSESEAATSSATNSNEHLSQKLDWRSRELALRVQVLKNQLALAKQDRKTISDICMTSKESIKQMQDDNLSKQKSILELWLSERRLKLSNLKEDLRAIKLQTMIRTKNMLEQISDIYPIIEFPDRKGYSICDIHLPNNHEFDGHDENMVSVAIGNVCHLLLLISDFLDVSLRFPVKYSGSKSTIYCNVNNQSFPLHIESSKNKEWPNFLYGVSLLNLDILQIRTSCGLPTNEPEDMLANLHDLKYFLLKS